MFLRSMCSFAAIPFRFFMPLLAVAVFLGAMYWAKSRDPFERIWFSVKVTNHEKMKGVVVLPKPVRPCPVAVYFHGSGGTLMTDGNALRQFAELGMAAVGMEYDQANQTEFDEQFIALNNYIKRQSWALANATAWIGSSLGAQRTLSFVLNHPDVQPQLLVRLSGGWVGELGEMSKVQDLMSEVGVAQSEHRVTNSGPSSILHPPSSFPLHCPVLLVHGEKDEVFSVQDAQRLAVLLKAQGVTVAIKILPERRHGFEPDRALVTRLVGEYCKAVLAPNEPFGGAKERRVWPFWVYFTPAFIWAGFWVWQKNGRKEALMRSKELRSPWEKRLRWAAFGLAILAIADTAAHLIPSRLKMSGATLNIARKWLVPSKWRTDFETLAAQPIWQGKQLKTLLEHVELANYDRNELINWKVDEQIYREFVLSPMIDSGQENLNQGTLKRVRRTGEELNWRRPLWESFYPRVRHEQTPEAAAEIVARYLRERVTISPAALPADGIESIWKRQITDEKGFECIYVAALRSVGIAARLNATGRAEFWTSDKWMAAPRPIASSFVRQ